MSAEKKNDSSIYENDRNLSDLVMNIYSDVKKDSKSEKVCSYKERLMQECITFLQNISFNDFLTAITNKVIGKTVWSCCWQAFIAIYQV